MRAVKLFGQLLISEHDPRRFRILGDKILGSVHLVIQLIWSWKRMILQWERQRGISSIYCCCHFRVSMGSELVEFTVQTTRLESFWEHLYTTLFPSVLFGLASPHRSIMSLPQGYSSSEVLEPLSTLSGDAGIFCQPYCQFPDGNCGRCVRAPIEWSSY